MPWSLNYDGGKHCELRLLLTVASVRVHVVVVGHAIRRTRKGGKKEEWGKSLFSSPMVHGMVKVQVVFGVMGYS